MSSVRALPSGISSSTPRKARLSCIRCLRTVGSSAVVVELKQNGSLRIVLDCRCGFQTVLRLKPERFELRVLDGSVELPEVFSARPLKSPGGGMSGESLG